jgi:hypothetical protein
MNHKSLLPQMTGLILVLLLLVACGTPQPAPTSVPPTPTFTPVPRGAINGQIMGAGSGEPLEGALIILCLLPEVEVDDYICTLQAAPTALSDASGAFGLSEVPAGSYVLMYGLSDELKSTPDTWKGVKVTKAEPCAIDISAGEKAAVCQSPKALENAFWQDGGTYFGSLTYNTIDNPDEIGAFIGIGMIYISNAAVRSNHLGISIMIADGKLAPVVNVQAGETTDIEWQVNGR